MRNITALTHMNQYKFYTNLRIRNTKYFINHYTKQVPPTRQKHILRARAQCNIHFNKISVLKYYTKG